MKCQQLTGIRQMRMVRLPVPALTRPNDVLLKIQYVGVCGSDVHYYETGRIGSQIVAYPFTVGHECSATVEDFGAGVCGLEKGQPVVVEPAVSCGQCDQCRTGRPHTCRALKFLGCPGQIEGCLCEYIVMPAECCFPTKGNLTLQQGVLCEPFAIGLYAVSLSGLRKGQTAAVLGTGPIGLSCLVGLRHQGAARIYGSEKIPQRCSIAKTAGADWVGNPDNEDIVRAILNQEPDGIDVVFECAGQQETLDQAVKILKPGGKLMLIGIPRQDTIHFSPDQIRRKEIAILNVRRQNHCTQKAIDLLADGRVNLDFMITHTFSFDQTQKAFDLVSGYRDGVVKALIRVS
ncbi:MAG: alcohol dehydrogenase catalytic domain-containing protein [Phycisphaerae bacterium]|nr:alcohol dehydrogenase catalytic domain-containing protein [Phycisphaerae bacterium]